MVDPVFGPPPQSEASPLADVNQVRDWAADIVHDQLQAGRRYQRLAPSVPISHPFDKTATYVVVLVPKY